MSFSKATNSTWPLAIFSAVSNSHPFEERRIEVTRNETQAIKIGRAVVRLQPAANNAIFDCKVIIQFFTNNINKKKFLKDINEFFKCY